MDILLNIYDTEISILLRQEMYWKAIYHLVGLYTKALEKQSSRDRKLAFTKVAQTVRG